MLFPKSEVMVMKKNIIAIALASIALIILVAALVKPWYFFDKKVDSETRSFKYTFSGFYLEGEEFDQYKPYTDEVFEGSEWVPVYQKTYYMTMAALALTVLLMIFVLFESVSGKKTARLGAFFGLMAFIVALAAPLYFMTELPEAAFREWNVDRVQYNLRDDEAPEYTKSFFGSETDPVSGEQETFGAGTGWYLSFAAAALNLVAFIILILIKKPKEVLPVKAPQPSAEMSV